MNKFDTNELINCFKMTVDLKGIEKLEEYITNLEKENNKLKEQVECLIKQRDDINKNATEHLEKNIDYTHIVKELRSWLEERLDDENDIFSVVRVRDVLFKLNKLENKGEENEKDI